MFLTGTAKREENWRSIIEAVRAIFTKPDSLTYAANWGEEERAIRWWDALDYIGIDAYYPLTKESHPSHPSDVCLILVVN